MQTIYVGDKAPIKYATAVAMEFEKGNKEVCIKARGKAISTAVDASQISINKFVKDAKIKEIKIFTEEIENKHISAIEILLSKE
ncbi:MAG: RNA-binding protein [Thermoplasmatales archaeon]|nr:RNA-binding protein [Thermoplasmatales archaeon]